MLFLFISYYIFFFFQFFWISIYEVVILFPNKKCFRLLFFLVVMVDTLSWTLLLIFCYLQDQTSHAGKFSKGQRIRSGASRKNPALYSSVNSETLWSDIQQFAKFKYQVCVALSCNMMRSTIWKFHSRSIKKNVYLTLLQFEIPEDARARIKKVSVIRNFCLKVSTKPLLFWHSINFCSDGWDVKCRLTIFFFLIKVLLSNYFTLN